MVVVDEVGKAIVDALMVWHVRIWRMDAHRLGHDFGQWPAMPQQFVVDPAAADLIARDQPILQNAIKSGSFLIGRCTGHSNFAPRSPSCRTLSIISRSNRGRQPRVRSGPVAVARYCCDFEPSASRSHPRYDPDKKVIVKVCPFGHTEFGCGIPPI